MPGYDRTGPMGYGPMTGRGFGPCGRGYGFRRGFGRGFNRGFYPRTSTRKEEKRYLEEEKRAIQEDLKEIEARLKDLNK